MPQADSYTITEAAAVCEVTRKAIARRVERHQIHTDKRGGVHYISRCELERVGLLAGASNATATRSAGLSPAILTDLVQLDAQQRLPAANERLDEEIARLLDLAHVTDHQLRAARIIVLLGIISGFLLGRAHRR